MAQLANSLFANMIGGAGGSKIRSQSRNVNRTIFQGRAETASLRRLSVLMLFANHTAEYLSHSVAELAVQAVQAVPVATEKRKKERSGSVSRGQ